MGENSGLHLLVEVDSPLTEEQIIDRCKKNKIRVYGLSEYYIERKTAFWRPVLLLGYGDLTEGSA
ncbi:MAG: hypothetical protein V8R80_11490 [Eubacterium sp.]